MFLFSPSLCLLPLENFGARITLIGWIILEKVLFIQSKTQEWKKVKELYYEKKHKLIAYT